MDRDGLAIAAAFASRVANIDGVATALDFEPEDLGELPCVTLFFRDVDHDVLSELGPDVDVTWRWRVAVYVPLTSYEEAQKLLTGLLPELLRVRRSDRLLGGTCVEWGIGVNEDDPVMSHDETYVLKTLDMWAVTRTT